MLSARSTHAPFQRIEQRDDAWRTQATRHRGVRRQRPSSQVQGPVPPLAGPRNRTIMNHAPIKHFDNLFVAECLTGALPPLVDRRQNRHNETPQLAFHVVVLLWWYLGNRLS